MAREPSYYEVLTAAINDMIEHGFDSAERLNRWQSVLAAAARRSLMSDEALAQMLRRTLETQYSRLVDKAKVLDLHPGISRVTYERVKPRLRGELDRRLMASLDLIRLNREESVARQARRFSGWATSLPIGGPAEPDRAATKKRIRQSMASLPFEERRVMIDQGHKLVSSINDVLATDGGAIAAKWRHVHQAGYDGRPDHEARDGKVFLIKGSWAYAAGLVRCEPGGYTEDVEQPAEFVFCRCSYIYLYNLRQLPEALLTEKGRARLASARALVEA
jgi:hypothetical protein